MHIQASETDGLLDSDWVCHFADRDAHMTQRRHYRLIMGTVGCSFRTVRGVHELLHAAYDVFTGESYDALLATAAF